MIETRLTKLLLSVCIYLISFNAGAEISSPFNKKLITETSPDYTFIVSGHFHGSSFNGSTFPAATLLANIDTLNSLKPAFLISLGDLFLDVDDNYIAHYQKALFNKLQMPLFNAVGNHDLANGNRYEKEYGKSFYYFIHGKELFIVLNTELNDGSIKGEQLDLLKEALAKINNGDVHDVFIFSHRPVWAEADAVYAKLFKDNTKSKFGVPNFEKEVLPLLQQLNLPVYWFSGSLGGGPASFFYDKNNEKKITFIQTAIRDTPRDAALQVKVTNGVVSLKGISFTGQELLPVEKYDILFWTQNVAPESSFNYRLIPYLTWLMITHHYFWTGFAVGIILILTLNWLIKKWRRKK